MMENEYIFTISVRWVQSQAIEQIGRELNEEELYKVSKGIETGLHFDIDTVMETVFNELDQGMAQLN